MFSRFLKYLVLLLLVLGLGLAAWNWWRPAEGQGGPKLRTAQVKRGDLVATISATGTLEPEEVIDVGSQVAGKILAFGKDQAGQPIDYGSVVTQGMVLAQIDAALYTADVAQSKAQLLQAQAGLERAEADMGQLRAKLVQTERAWKRAQQLDLTKVLAQADYDAALANYEVAKANIEVGKGSISQARAAIAQAEAGLRRTQQNLDYCTIRSPVQGVIIDRRVNIGQTVVSSLNAPSLFLIAKDLSRMQVWVAVNEADVGHIRPGQRVNFSVDAFPGELFRGEVGQLRLNATMVQNVVTYTVEVVTENPQGKLLPYLTANVKFLVSEHPGVLLVPNSALRWKPRPEQTTSEEGAALLEAKTSRDRPARSKGQQDGGTEPPSNSGLLWVLRDGSLHPYEVRTGATDGSQTEVSGGGLEEGMTLAIGEQTPDAAPTNAASPFMPRMFGGSGRSSRQ